MAKSTGVTGAWTVRLEGLSQLVNGLQRTSRVAGREVRKGLRRSTLPIARMAQSIARGQGLVSDDPRTSGGLVKGIRPWATASAVGIVERATRAGGFSYPSVWEYGGRGGNAVGPRAFMLPAAERGAPLAEGYALEAIMDAIDGAGA